MGDALVGGYAKSKEDFSGIWSIGDDFLCSVFGIGIFLRAPLKTLPLMTSTPHPSPEEKGTRSF